MNNTVNVINDKVFKYLPGELIGMVCVAGGAVLDLEMGVKPKDYDIFCDDEESLMLTCMALEEVCISSYESQCAANFSMSDGTEIQVITKILGIHKAIELFDIEVCKMAVIFGDGTVYHFGESFPDMTTGETKLNHVWYPRYTMKRVKRYEDKGFTFRNRWLVEEKLAEYEKTNGFNEEKVEYDAMEKPDKPKKSLIKKLFSFFS